MQQIFKRYPISPIVLTVLISIYFTLVINFPFWQLSLIKLGHIDNLSYGFALSIIFTLGAFITLLFSLLTVKYLLKPFLLIMVIFSGLAFVAANNYGILFSYDIIESFFETSNREAASYISPSAVLSLLAVITPPCLLLFKTKLVFSSPLIHLAKVGALLAVCVSILAINSVLYFSSYASFFRNNKALTQVIIPHSYLRESYRYARNNYISPKKAHKQIGLDAKINPDLTNARPRTIVVILGETARAANYPFNGYTRNTNPYTEKLNTINITKVSSCGTATSQSLPCMFSQIQRENYDKKNALGQDNILDIAQRAGYQVSWIDNNDGCKGVCSRIPNEPIDPMNGNLLCDGTYCFDEILLEKLGVALQKAETDSKPHLIVLHIMGSHGPTYYRRYPPAFNAFMPDCQTSNIQNCTQQELVNTYDNTILYTDFIVASSIKMLQQYNVNGALTYISDHGESLGENGVYLHGLPYALAPKEQTTVPWQIWLSDNLVNNEDKSQCLSNNINKGSISHDNLFHTLLSLTNVETSLYNKKLNVLAECIKG